METKKKSLGSEVAELLKNNVKSYMMYFALIIIMLVFQIWSGGKFFRASNITNLFNQAAYVGVLAIGMTLILILKHIDLSVGYVAGFTGALAAILMQREGVNEWLAILIVLLVGLVIGLYQGLTVTRLGVPAFVVTLAGMFIFRGLLSRTLAESGTVVVSQKGFLALCNGFIPDIPVKTGIHMVTMIVGVLAVIIVILSQIKNRKNKQKYQFEVVSTPIFVIGMVLVSAVLLAVCWVLATYKGIPWSAVIVGVILLIYTFMLSKTKLGRYIYGIGGNDQAAELSGVNVKQVTLFAYPVCLLLHVSSGCCRRYTLYIPPFFRHSYRRQRLRDGRYRLLLHRRHGCQRRRWQGDKRHYRYLCYHGSHQRHEPHDGRYLLSVHRQGSDLHYRRCV